MRRSLSLSERLAVLLVVVWIRLWNARAKEEEGLISVFDSSNDSHDDYVNNNHVIRDELSRWLAVGDELEDSLDHAASNGTMEYASDSTYPTLTLRLRIGFETNQGREPNQDEVLAVMCQMQRYLTWRLQEKTGDSGITIGLHTLQWYYDASSSVWQIEFTLHSTFGSNGDTVSPWTMIPILELQTTELQWLVRNYLWTLDSTVFGHSHQVYLGGVLGDPIVNEPTWRNLEASSRQCLPGPPTLPPTTNIFQHVTEVPVPEAGNLQIIINTNPITSEDTDFGYQTRVPLSGSGNIMSAPEKFGSDSGTKTHQLTLPISFWAANRNGILDPIKLQHSWLEPSFNLLIDSIVSQEHKLANHSVAPLIASFRTTTHHVQQQQLEIVPNSPMIIQVNPSLCPLPQHGDSYLEQALDNQAYKAWYCYEVLASYQVEIQYLSIPLMVHPGQYSNLINGAIENGVYQEILFDLASFMDTHTMPPQVFLVGAVQGDGMKAVREAFIHSDKSSPYSWATWLEWVIIFGGKIVLVGLLVMMSAWLYCRLKVQRCQVRQQQSSGEMEALALYACVGNDDDVV